MEQKTATKEITPEERDKTTTPDSPAPSVISERNARWNILASKLGPEYSACRVKNWVFHGDDSERFRQNHMLTNAKSYFAKMRANVKAGRGLFLYGPKGTGKDFIVSAALRHAVQDLGLFARWVNGVDFFLQIREAMRSDSEVSEFVLISRLAKVPILAISDPLPPIGALTEFQASTLFSLIDARYRARLPTWITANVINSEEARSRLGGQLVDRMIHNSEVLFCNWGSYREMERNANK